MVGQNTPLPAINIGPPWRIKGGRIGSFLDTQIKLKYDDRLFFAKALVLGLLL
ncbi:MAG: hypothetical protein JKY01_01480 [Pseudomonadales bacterium]|nr:hypothetical protein [Pseudomonadales bacterium]